MALTRGGAALPMFVLALAVSAGCGDQPGPEPTAAPSDRPSAVAGFGGPPPIEARDVADAMFRTPSGNITCDLSPSSVRCDIADKRWTPPPRPASCDLDWGNGLYIAAGKAGMTCAGDTLIGSAETSLDYGRALRSGDVRCDSRSAGVTCTSERTGHGFTLAAGGYETF